MARKILAPQRRMQIVEALFNCLSESGHETVTIKDIARKANLHYGVIHYYFKSKDDIVSSMADWTISKYETLLLKRMEKAHSATEKLHVATDFLKDEFIFNRRLNRVFYNLVQMAFERETVREALRRQLRVYRRHISEVIEEGMKTGEFPPLQSERTASLMVAVIEGMALQWVIDPSRLRREDAQEIIRETVERRFLHG